MPPRRRRRKRLARPVQLSELLDRRTRKWRFRALARLEIIRQVWPEAAGEFVAAHVQPARLARKQLRLAVQDASWANEMAYLAPAILERLRGLLPGPWIDELKVVPSEPWPGPPEPPAGLVLGPPTEAMRREAGRSAAGLADPDLAAAVERAALARLRRLDATAGGAVDKDQTTPTNQSGEE